MATRRGSVGPSARRPFTLATEEARELLEMILDDGTDLGEVVEPESEGIPPGLVRVSREEMRAMQLAEAQRLQEQAEQRVARDGRRRFGERHHPEKKHCVQCGRVMWRHFGRYNSYTIAGWAKVRKCDKCQFGEPKKLGAKRHCMHCGQIFNGRNSQATCETCKGG